MAGSGRSDHQPPIIAPGVPQPWRPADFQTIPQAGRGPNDAIEVFPVAMGEWDIFRGIVPEGREGVIGAAAIISVGWKAWKRGENIRQLLDETMRLSDDCRRGSWIKDPRRPRRRIMIDVRGGAGCQRKIHRGALADRHAQRIGKLGLAIVRA